MPSPVLFEWRGGEKEFNNGAPRKRHLAGFRFDQNSIGNRKVYLSILFVRRLLLLFVKI